jgi:hypothetical protein
MNWPRTGNVSLYATSIPIDSCARDTKNFMENNFSNTPEVKWSSFMPALGKALAVTTGPVLEIGVGHFSTPFLHAYCEGAKRRLVSLEADAAWGDEFEKSYGQNPETHSFIIGPYVYDVLRLSKWGVVFIDNSPGGEARLRPFLAFSGSAQRLVIHDFHRENSEAIMPQIEAMGMKVDVYGKYDPPTALIMR